MANGQVLKHRVFTTYIGDVLVILTWKKIKKSLTMSSNLSTNLGVSITMKQLHARKLVRLC